MTKFLKKYNDIMEMYKCGEFGEDHLTLNDILIKANAPDLIEKMSLTEIEYLVDHSSGMVKQMFCYIKNQKLEFVEKTRQLEEELLTYQIDLFCENDNVSDDVLAERLKLNVQYFDELSEDVEAELSPPNDDSHVGIIKILKTCANKFSYMHEIMHYFRDVGIGNKVECVYARKRKGKTDSVEEQEINYLTAAAVMPIDKIIVDLKEYENISFEEEPNFLASMAEKYSQDVNAVSRRFIEARCLVDVGYNASNIQL